MKQEEIEEYFKTNSTAIMNYHHEGWFNQPPQNFVFFVPWNTNYLMGYGRPIIDEFGHKFFVNGNQFSGTCNEFRWDTVVNLEFARNIKQWQGANQGVPMTCSCKCRVEGQKS